MQQNALFRLNLQFLVQNFVLAIIAPMLTINKGILKLFSAVPEKKLNIFSALCVWNLTCTKTAPEHDLRRHYFVIRFKMTFEEALACFSSITHLHNTASAMYY